MLGGSINFIEKIRFNCDVNTLTKSRFIYHIIPVTEFN
jgi:hypothetical protein